MELIIWGDIPNSNHTNIELSETAKQVVAEALGLTLFNGGYDGYEIYDDEALKNSILPRLSEEINPKRKIKIEYEKNEAL